MAVGAEPEGWGRRRLRAALAPGSWSDVDPHPWRRYFARIIDTAISGWLTLIAIGGVIHLAASPEGWANFGLYLQQRWVFLQAVGLYIAAIPANAAMIGLTGSSVGKWIFGVRVLGGDGRPLGLRRALLREVDVCVWGLGGGVLTNWRAWVRLETGRPIWWDALQPDVVSYRRGGLRAWAAPALGLVAAMAAIAALGWLVGR